MVVEVVTIPNSEPFLVPGTIPRAYKTLGGGAKMPVLQTRQLRHRGRATCLSTYWKSLCPFFHPCMAPQEGMGPTGTLKSDLSSGISGGTGRHVGQSGGGWGRGAGTPCPPG